MAQISIGASTKLERGIALQGLPARKHIVLMQHKFVPKQRVRNIAEYSRNYGKEGVIVEQAPFTFISPGYYVDYGSGKVADSERHLEGIGD